MIEKYYVKTWLTNPQEYAKGARSHLLTEESESKPNHIGYYNNRTGWLLVDVLSAEVDIDRELIPSFVATEADVLSAYIENEARNASKS